MTDQRGPRHRFRATTSDEWLAGVVAGEITPRTITEAIAVAFTFAVEDAIGDDGAYRHSAESSTRRDWEERIAPVDPRWSRNVAPDRARCTLAPTR